MSRAFVNETAAESGVSRTPEVDPDFFAKSDARLNGYAQRATAQCAIDRALAEFQANR